MPSRFASIVKAVAWLDGCGEFADETSTTTMITATTPNMIREALFLRARAAGGFL
jgi:hypothetical protein